MQDDEDSDGFIVPLMPRTSRLKYRCGVCGGKGPSRENELRQSRLRTQSRIQPVTGASARTCSCTLRSRQEPDAGKPQVRICEGGAAEAAPLLDKTPRAVSNPPVPPKASSLFGHNATALLPHRSSFRRNIRARSGHGEFFRNLLEDSTSLNPSDSTKSNP